MKFRQKVVQTKVEFTLLQIEIKQLFENSSLAKYSPDNPYGKAATDALTKGEVYIPAIVIEPKELTSLVEVYLQTHCLLVEGLLPILNKQIG